jgi:pimeloyl-ACP methyl ester carboxylesterase
VKCRVNIGTTTLYVEDEGEGTAIVLIHGLTLDCRMWGPQLSVLAKRFRVIAYDVRGFGQSDDPTDEPYTDWQDLRALLDVLDIQRACVVGLSRGGRVALEFARCCPERVLKMIVIDTNPRLADGPLAGRDWFAPLRQEVADLAIKNPAHAADTWLTAEIWRSPNGPADPMITGMVRDYFPAHKWGTTRRNTDLTMADVANIQIETLVMVGSDDIDEFQESAKQLRNLLPRSTLRTIPKAGHMANVDNPEFTNKAMMEFFFAAGPAGAL